MKTKQNTDIHNEEYVYVGTIVHVTTCVAAVMLNRYKTCVIQIQSVRMKTVL